MRKLLFLAMATTLLIACKNEASDKQDSAPEEKSEAQLLAEAHGYHNWDQVNTIKFTFNVDRPDRHFDRTWTWEPKTGNVLMQTERDTVDFNHKKLDSAAFGADTGFINDKYWLLAPFNLMWDDTATITTSEKAEAPMSKDTLKMLTIVYPAEGGYTPGDAYDFYYDQEYNIKEWVFRTKNQEEASMITSWEGMQEINGLKIYTDHKDMSGELRIHFTDVSVN